MRIMAALVTMNAKRKPNVSASTPPMNGPTVAPAKMDICMVPNTRPSSSRGVMEAARALTAAVVPVSEPWMTRKINNCTADCANPINSSVMAAPTSARSSMSFLPKRSARVPQIGEKIAMLMPDPPATSPAQSAAWRGSGMPSSRMYNGTKGRLQLKAAMVANCVTQRMRTVACQLPGCAVDCILAMLLARRGEAQPKLLYGRRAQA